MDNPTNNGATPDEYSTPIPEGATIGSPAAPSAAPQNAQASQQTDEYSTPIPAGATFGTATIAAGSTANPQHKTMFDANSVKPETAWRPEGVVKDVALGMGETGAKYSAGTATIVNRGTSLLNKLLPSLNIPTIPQVETSDYQSLAKTDEGTIGEKVGSGIGEIAAFMLMREMGGAAFSALPESAQFSEIGKVTQFLEKHKYIAESLKTAMNMGATAHVASGGQAMPTAEGAAEGAIVGPAGVALADAAGAVGGAIGKGTRNIDSYIVKGELPDPWGLRSAAFKDELGKFLGKTADADVVDMASDLIGRKPLLSDAANESKRILPKVLDNLDGDSEDLVNMLHNAPIKVKGAATKISDAFVTMTEEARAGMGNSGQAEKAISRVYNRFAGKLTDTPMGVETLVDLRRDVGDAISTFKRRSVVSSAAQAEQAALQKAYGVLNDMVSESFEPANVRAHLEYITRNVDAPEILDQLLDADFINGFRVSAYLPSDGQCLGEGVVQDPPGEGDLKDLHRQDVALGVEHRPG